MDRPTMDPRTLTLAISRALFDQSARFRTAVEQELAPGKGRKAREEVLNRIGALLARACNVGMARITGSATVEARADREMDALRTELRADPALHSAMQKHLPLLEATPRPGAPRLARLTRDVLTAALHEE